MSSRIRATVITAGAVLSLWAACAKKSTRAGEPRSSEGDPPHAASALGNACERGTLSRDDFEGILREPITGSRAIPGDAQSCAFMTSGMAHIEVTVRPSLGRATVQSWIDGRMPLESTPLRGVGERAAWQPDLHEVIAEKDDVLCDIAVVGLEPELDATSRDSLPHRVGALCNKVFASIR